MKSLFSHCLLPLFIAHLGAPLASAQSGAYYQLPVGIVGEAYVVGLEDYVEDSEFQWTVEGDYPIAASGDVSLIAGLFLDPTAGRIYGTPDSAFGLDLTLTATDSGGSIIFSGSFVLEVTLPDDPDPNEPDIVFDPPLAFTGEPYRFVFADFWPELAGASWTALTPEDLPPGLTLSEAGVLGGTPTDVTDRSVAVSILTLDKSERRGLIIIPTVERPDPEEADPLSLAYDPTEGIPFSADLGSDLGIPGIEFAVEPGSSPLPADYGLSLTTDGTLSGTPNQVGPVEWGITFVDSSTGEVRDLVVTLYVSAPLTRLATSRQLQTLENAYEVEGMGTLRPVAGSGWVHSNLHGWLYFTRFSAGNLFYADPDLGNVASSLADWPHLYSYDRAGWLWYANDTTNPRWFYSWKDAKWFAVETPSGEASL